MAAKTRDIGPYKDAELFGRGGFGSVYKASDASHGRDVAIKVLQGQLGETERRRFDRERQTMGRLGSHPNIVPVYDSGYTEAGEGYIVMQLATGGSLRERIDREGPIPWGEATTIMASIAKAAEAAHGEGVLHRDIKPDNILIDQYGNPKLTDFGIAAVASNATATTSMTATVAHAAPEILQGHTGNHAIDIYAVGSTFYNLVTGLPPFQRADDFGVPAMITRALTEDPPDLRAHGVPDGVAKVVEKSLSKEPGARQSSASQLADELLAAKARADADAASGVPSSPPVADAGATQVAPPIDVSTFGSVAPSGPLGPPQAPPPGRAAPPVGFPAPPGGAQHTPPPGGYQHTPHPGGAQHTPPPGGYQHTPPPGGYQHTPHPGGAQHSGGYQPQGLSTGGYQPPSESGGSGRGLLIGLLAAAGVIILGVGGYFLATRDGGTDSASSTTSTSVDTLSGGESTSSTTEGSGTASGESTTSSSDTTTSTTTTTTSTTSTTTATEDQLEGTFGSISLRAGFEPDPYSVDIVSGGPNPAVDLNQACEGFIADDPDYVVRWSGTGDILRFLFVSNVEFEDSTLIIEGPDGLLYCEDDSDGTLDPQVNVGTPATGDYAIWVGSFSAEDFINGKLYVSELDISVADFAGG